ncbi:MAG: hypothetical protein JRH20_09095 [Deltaproteobacteria bacterium]|nr:hypothetical protein [Deltaproteobacteria bacterium]
MEKYRVVVSPLMEGEGDEAKVRYRAKVTEVPGAEVIADTREAALGQLEEELAAQLENLEEQGEHRPTPLLTEAFDGKLALKVSPELHRDLVAMAHDADIELEPLLIELLTRAASEPRGGRRGGGRPHQRQSGGGRRGRRGGPDGQQYHNIMEDRASFIQYVREQGGSSDGRGGRGRGHR